MKRLHVDVGVDDLAASIRFYSTLFAAEPTVCKADYAKWMLENPRVNFAISHGRIHHLGIQVEDQDEFGDVYHRLKAADAPLLEEGATVCCRYAQSQRSWIADPQGIAWETFLTHGESTVYGGNAPAIGSNPGEPFQRAVTATGCCTPALVLVSDSACACGTKADE